MIQNENAQPTIAHLLQAHAVYNSGFTFPIMDGAWCYSGAFIVRLQDGPDAENPVIRMLVAKKPGFPVEISAKPHDSLGPKGGIKRCTGRLITGFPTTQKKNSLTTVPVLRELAYPLFQLTKALKVETFRVMRWRGQWTLQGYLKNQRLVAVMALRRMPKNHLKEPMDLGATVVVDALGTKPSMGKKSKTLGAGASSRGANAPRKANKEPDAPLR